MKRIIYFIALISCFGCRDNIDDLTIETIEDPIVILVENSLKGRVVSQTGNPLSFAEVDIRGQVVRTDAYGRFFYNKVDVKKEGGSVVTAKLDGYFKGITHSNFTPGSAAFVEITMIEKGDPIPFDASQGGSIKTEDNLSISFPKDVIVTSSGEPYDGKVDVFSKWIDPTADDMAEIMPGALTASDENGEPLALVSYGMLSLEMEDENGMPLMIADNKELDVELPIPNELEDEAPDEIPLWYFDIEQDQWVNKGECRKVGSSYSFKITSGGYWNCDIPLPAICLSGNILNVDSTSASYMKVQVKDLTDNFIYFGYTNINGFFCGSVPRGADLEISIIDHCDNVIYQDQIGPFSVSIMIPDILLTANIETYLFNVSGSIQNCDLSMVENGYVSVVYPSSIRIFPFVGDAFEFDVAFKCSDFPEVEIKAHSSLTNMSTFSTILLDQSDVTINNELTCETYNDFINWSFDNNNYVNSPTQFYFKNNATTNWLIMEAYNGESEIKIEVRDYTGIGIYTSGVILNSTSETFDPAIPLLNLSSPDISLEVTSDDGSLIEGILTGQFIDSSGISIPVNSNFRVKKSI